MEGKDVCILYGECAICKTLMCASMQARAVNTGRTPVDPTMHWTSSPEIG